MRHLRLEIAALFLILPFAATADSITVGGAFPGDFTLITMDDVFDDPGNPLEVVGLATISANSLTLDNNSNDFSSVDLSTTGSMTVVGASDMSGSFAAGGEANITTLTGSLIVDLLSADSALLVALGGTVSLTNAQDIMIAQLLSIVADTIFIQFTDGSAPNLSSLDVGSLSVGDAEIIISSVATSISEPAIFTLLGIGLAGMGLARRKRKSDLH